MDHIDFQERQIVGGKVSQLAADGLVPAVVYNSKAESFNIQIAKSEAEKIARLATSTTVIDAKLNGKEIKTLVKEIDTDPKTDVVRHIAFFQLDEDAEQTFSIPFNLVGVAPAVKNSLGVLVKALPEIEVRCKLADLVPAIDIDISGLEHPGQSIAVNDITLPKGMSLPNDEHAMSAIVTITNLQKEEEVVVAAPAEGEAAEGEEGAEAPTEGEAAEGDAEAPAEEAKEE